MFSVGDMVELNKIYPTVFGNLIYKITRVRGFWIFRSYDIEAYDSNDNKITQEKVLECQLLKLKEDAYDE